MPFLRDSKKQYSFIISDTSIRKLAQEFNIPKSVLQRHIAAAEKGTLLKPKGRSAVFSNEEMNELKSCIVDIWLILVLHQQFPISGKL